MPFSHRALLVLCVLVFAHTAGHERLSDTAVKLLNNPVVRAVFGAWWKVAEASDQVLEQRQQQLHADVLAQSHHERKLQEDQQEHQQGEETQHRENIFEGGKPAQTPLRALQNPVGLPHSPLNTLLCSLSVLQGEDDGSSVLPVDKYLESRDGERPLGVYALYDEKHNLQYVGYNRNIVLAVKGHLLRVGESRCAFIRPMVFANKAMATRSHMEQQVQDWLAEAGTVPPGNGVEAHLWDGGSEDSSASASASIEAELLAKMSPAERAAYEDKKLKLRKAMGESLHDDADIDATATQRRLALLAAVKGDNWSAVVSEQTQATLTAAVAAGGGRQGGRQLPPDVAAPHPHHVAGRQSTAAAAGSDAAAVASAGGGDGDSGPVVSPFSMASVHRQVGEQHKTAAQQGDQPAMTVESVTAALEDVRPYLLADGGDVTVMDVNTSTGVIMVELQGACSSCASSSATLKMGIERQLKSVFGEAVSEVIQVNTGGGRPSASVEAIDMHLNMLRSAVANLGGSVEVASVGGGVCVLSFKGPAAIGKGLSAAIKDAFPDVKEVVLRDA